MEALGKPSGLVRREGSASWYFRQRWPERYRRDDTPAEIWISLDTAVYETAKTRLDDARAEARRRFEQQPLPDQTARSPIYARTVRLTWPADGVHPALTSEHAAPLAQAFFQRVLRAIDAEPPTAQDQPSDEAFVWRAELEDRLARLSGPMDGEEPDDVSGAIASVLQEAGLRTEPGSEPCNLLHNYVRRAMVQATSIRLARLAGDYGSAVTDSLFVPGGAGALPAVAAGPVAARSAPTGVTEIMLAVATEQYLAGLLQKPRSLKTEDRYRSEIRHIVAFFGSSTPVWTINESECDRFRDAFGLLPPNFEDHIRRGASIADIVAKRAQADRTLAWATHHKYLSQLSRFLRWAHKRDYLAKSYGDDLKPLGAKPQASVAKLPFEDEELRRVFARPIYTGCRDDERGFARPGDAIVRRARYWAPLIALYSGLRCGEILQLTTDHFRVSPAGNDFIVLTPDMMLKNGNAEREIPVHTMLQRIGLIDWVNRRRDGDPVLLFPEVPNHSKYDDKSTRFSKWYESDLKHFDLGERRSKLTFHSFRHTFKQGLNRADVPENKMDEICGWARAKKQGRRYGIGLEADVLATSVNAVSYDIDIRHLLGHSLLGD